MKKYLFIVLLVGVCFGQKNPCEEGLYIYLSNQRVENLSKQDMEMLKRLNQECLDYKSSLKLKENQLLDGDVLFNKAMEMVRLMNGEGEKLIKEMTDIYNFQKNNGSFGQGAFYVIMPYLMDINKTLKNISSITFYYREIKSCGGNNFYARGDFKIRFEALQGYIGLTKDAIYGESELLKNDYSVSKLVDGFNRYMDKLQGIIDS